jgi:mevalonate pyrophosphate decarboxylase
MKKEDFIYNNNFVAPLSGSSHWESPSNIALVKYWGKSRIEFTSYKTVESLLT